MILRHFDVTYSRDRILALPRYDGFVWQEGHGHEGIVNELRAKHKWLYGNVLTLPPPEWEDPLPPWLAAVRATVPALRVNGEIVRSWAGGRAMWDWFNMNNTLIAQTARLLVERAQIYHKMGLFLDLSFMRPEAWMAPGVVLPMEKERYWTRHMRYFYRNLAGVNEGRGVLSNGSRTCPTALYLEHAERNWWSDLAYWMGATNNVLSVDVVHPQYVDQIVDLHRRYPDRWVAFTSGDGDEAAVDAAYERLV